MRRTDLGIEVIDVTPSAVTLNCGDVREALVLAAVEQEWGDPVTLIPYLSDRAVLNIVRDVCARHGQPDFQHGRDHHWPDVGEFAGDHLLYAVARDRARRFWKSDLAGATDRVCALPAKGRSV